MLLVTVAADKVPEKGNFGGLMSAVAWSALFNSLEDASTAQTSSKFLIETPALGLAFLDETPEPP